MAKRDVFSGTTALVTGASSGLGEEFARELARRHCNLVLTARSREKLEQLASDLSRVNGVTVQVIVQDLAAEGGALRPDLLVRMPDNRSIVVDAKTPLDAYLAAVEADTDEARREALSRHARQVDERVRELGRKSYWEQFEHSPEFAVLFLPGDQFLSAALAEKPDLIDAALSQRIIVTTPSTLMALLKVIAYGWRQSRVTENAREIKDLGQELHKRLGVFVGHLQKVGRSLGGAIDAFNSAVGSMERNVLPQARKFGELGATTDEPIDPVDPIEKGVRTLAAAAAPAPTPLLEPDDSSQLPGNPS